MFLSSFVVVAQLNTPYNCSRQLHNYYVANGLNASYPVLPVINYTTGFLIGGVPYVQASLDFQFTARAYQFELSNSSVPLPYVSYVSFDVPWCATDVSMQCINSSRIGSAKICTNIIDWDQGTPSQIIGRFVVYANQTAGCDGRVVVTFTNAYLYEGTMTANYVYDLEGIVNFTLLSPEDAQFQYRFAGCDYTSGSNLTMAYLQPQLACVDALIGCNTTRPTSSPNRPVVPIPRYACYHNRTNITDDQYMVWFVYSMQPPGGVEGTFRYAIIDPVQLGAYYDGVFNPFTDGRCDFLSFIYNNLLWRFFFNLRIDPLDPCTWQMLLPSTRREFYRYGTDFRYSMLINTNNGIGGTHTTVIRAKYLRSNDNVIKIIPCICGFSMDCDANGNIDTFNIDHHIFVANQRPIAAIYGGYDITIPQGTPNVTLNGNLSADADGSPVPYLTYYWKCYNITNYTWAPVTGIPMFTFENELAQQTVAYTGHLLPGFYMVILYVSDGQDVTFTLFNFTILANIITAVAPPDFADYLVPCDALTPSTCIPLNASRSFQTANLTLFYNWTQVTGWNVWPALFDPVCNDYIAGLFNYTSEVACFIPPYLGLYQFCVTVYDNITATSTDCVYINIVPPGSPLTVPNITVAPFPTAPTRSDPPINRPYIGFPNGTDIPFTGAPFATGQPTPNTTVAPLFPIYPPLTTGQKISMFAVLFAGLIVIVMFAGLWIVLMPQNEYNYLDRIRYFYQ